LGKKGKQEGREEGRNEGREREREGGRKGGREEGREGEREEGGREGGRKSFLALVARQVLVHTHVCLSGPSPTIIEMLSHMTISPPSLPFSLHARVTAVSLNTIMYAAPLSSMITVVKTRNASSIYFPWAMGSVLCSTCWAIYGLFGVHDVRRREGAGGWAGGREGKREGGQ